MGLDFDKIVERKNTKDAKNAARAVGGIKWFDNLKVGENPIRILPPWTTSGPNANDFCREIYQHWGVDPSNPKVPFTCPRRTPDLDGDCPICAYAQSLRKTGDPLDAETAKDLSAKVKYLSNVVDLEDPVYTKDDIDKARAAGQEIEFAVGDTKVKVWRYGSKIYKDLLDYIHALKKDITALDSGRDIVIIRVGTGRYDTNYSVVVRDPSPLSVQGKLPVVDLDVLNPPKTYAEMSDVLNSLDPVDRPELPSVPSPTALPSSQTSGDDLISKMQQALKEG